MNDTDLLGMLLKEKGIWALIAFYVIKEVVKLITDKGKLILQTALESKDELKSIRTEMNNRFDKLTSDMNTAFYNIKKMREKSDMGPIETPKVEQ